MVANTAAKNLLFSTVCIEGMDGAAVCSAGTGFLMAHDIPGYGPETFLVTNKHVVEGLEHARFRFTRKMGEQPALGRTFTLSCPSRSGTAFHRHPNPGIDIAVLPISFLLRKASEADQEPFITTISTKTIPAQEEMNKFDAMLRVLFVGYPNGLYDSRNCTPIIRSGITATPVELDFCGEPVFLVDASVFPGSSGSPVFAYSETWAGGIDSLQLLGIIASVFIRRESGKFRQVPAPTAMLQQVEFEQMIDLGVVFKSRLIIESIEDCWKHKGDELKRVNRNS